MDLLICVSLFPVIDAFIEDPGYPDFSSKSPIFFGNSVFCTAWGMLWEILPSFSVYLVGVLGISRLVLLTWKRALMVPSIVYLFMATYLLITLSVKVFLLMTYDDMDYEPMSRYCFLVSHLDDNFAKHEITTLAIMISQLALPIIPVTVCFVITMVKLLKDRKNLPNTKRTCLQRHAAITVALVTLLYILFNIPVVVNFSFYLYHLIYTEGDMQFAEVYSNRYLFYYAWPSVYVVCVGVNSALNPCVLFWRMERYRTFVVNVVEGEYIHGNSRVSKTVEPQENHGNSRVSKTVEPQENTGPVETRL